MNVLIEALKGAQAEVAAQQSLIERLRRAGKLTGIMAQEFRTAVSLSPFGLRAMRVRSSLPAAGTPAADRSPYGVVLYAGLPYGPKPRNMVDIYVPVGLYRQTNQQHSRPPPPQQQHPQNQQHQQHLQPEAGSTAPGQSQQQPQQPQQAQQQQLRQLPQQQQQQQQPEAPVVFFVHGGIWVTGERWHFGPMATRLAQAGIVVAVVSYTLYPDALAGEMAAEVLAAYKWAAVNVSHYGGNPHNITVIGHSAGGHLGSLALLMLAQQKHEAATALEQQQTQQQQQQQPLDGTQQHSSGDGSSNGSRSCGMQLHPGGEIQWVSGHHHQQQQQKQQQQAQRAWQLPKQQLQQRADVAAVTAVRHPQHAHQAALNLPNANTHRPRPLQQAAQQQQQTDLQQWQQWQQQPGTGQAVLSVPQPVAFIGMASVYDVARHFEFESMRGVAGISTMARACGGPISFDAISPAVLLRRAAADGEGESTSSSTSSSGGGDSSTRMIGRVSRNGNRSAYSQQQQQSMNGASSDTQLLLGEVIPIRSGLDTEQQHTTLSSAVPGTAACSSVQAVRSTGPQQHYAGRRQADATAGALVGSSGSSGIANDVLHPFSLAAAAYVPPCILMSSLADHMVPWHEAAEMHLALCRCGVPSKHLIYDRALHNDFCLDWLPVSIAAASSANNNLAAPSNRGGESTAVASSSSSSTGGLPPFARDLLNIVLGKTTVRFVTGSGNGSAASLEALEREAGLPPRLTGASQSHREANIPPQPLSRL